MKAKEDNDQTKQILKWSEAFRLDKVRHLAMLERHLRAPLKPLTQS